MLPKQATSLLFCFLLLALALPLHAAPTAEELQNSIAIQNARITDLEKEIARYQTELDAVGKQKQTLQTAIKTLDLSSRKLATDIKVTQTHIDTTNLELKRLSLTINGTTDQITHTTAGLAESLRSMEQAEEEPFVVTFFANPRLSDFLDTLTSLQNIQTSLADEAETLRNLKISLEDQKTKTEKTKKKLITYQQQLANQKKGLDISRAEKTKLLNETKNQETNYQKLIAQKKAEQNAFEAELLRLAAELGRADTSSAPRPVKGILDWPLDRVSVTQYFGNTSFSLSGGYNGNGHNGIDLRATIGTPVKAMLSGTVQEINLGAVKYCQYGKWVLVKHDNGLASLYAHLSGIAVAKGQRVVTGQAIGYSGDTGYATGPHLHLTLYVASAVSFKQYRCNSGATAFIPIAPLNAYLNPLSYL